tara:strand:+ start:783 stop:983 length:201 start_codon:yes stop_codon:yes gene_type:complete
MNNFNIGDLVEIKDQYKDGYAKDLTSSLGIIVEFCKDNTRAKVLYPSRENKILLYLYLVEKVTENA